MLKQSGLDVVLNLRQQGLNDADIIDYMKQQGFKPKEILESMNQAKIKQMAEISQQAPTPTEQAPQQQISGSQQTPKEEMQGMKPSILTQAVGRMPNQQVPVPTPTPEQATQPATQQQAQPFEGPIPQPQEGVQAPQGYQYQYPAQYPQGYEYGYENAGQTETIEQLSEEIIDEKWNEFKKKFGDISDIKKDMMSEINSLNSRVEKLEQRFDKINLMLIDRMKVQERTVGTVGKEIGMLETTFKKVLNPLMTNIQKLNEIVGELKKVKKGTKVNTKKQKSKLNKKTKNI